jgi:hypothetical protein
VFSKEKVAFSTFLTLTRKSSDIMGEPNGQSGVDTSLPNDRRGAVQIAVALALAAVLVVTAAAVNTTAPTAKAAPSSNPKGDVGSIATGIENSLHTANRKTIDKTNWDGTTPATGHNPSGPSVRPYVSQATWNGLSPASKQTLQTHYGAFIESIKTQYASDGE